MAPTFKQLTNWFIETGADSVSHTKKGYLTHAIGVYNGLKKWGYDEGFPRSGLFHSIYGTQKFQGFTLSLDRRGEIRNLIGDYPERLCYLNSLMQRETLYSQLSDNRESYAIENRETSELMELDRQTFDDLCTLHLCDWLEQVERSDTWDFQRSEFRAIADRLGGVAKQNYDRVFAREPVS